mmetsp:Transcript_22691/g.49564  ORF Transcript_22691/g.49564 Transcript_22691/m.49564 type:complete len:106 (-) Transcript_22691:483-800(-)
MIIEIPGIAMHPSRGIQNRYTTINTARLVPHYRWMFTRQGNCLENGQESTELDGSEGTLQLARQFGRRILVGSIRDGTGENSRLLVVVGWVRERAGECLLTFPLP